MTGFDAVLLLSFGGPEGPDDVMPFLRNVTAGRGVPDERLAVVAEQYLAVGGKSPINEQNQLLRAALAEELDIPVYWGNRNWDPYVADTLRQMRDDGVRKAAVLITSGYASYSGCRQYREDLAAAVAQVAGAPELFKVQRWSRLPAFVEVMVDNILESIKDLAPHSADDVRIVFTTHSIPEAANQASGDPALGGGAYEREHRWAADAIAEGVNNRLGANLEWDLVFQSRSGAPHIPWLEPDIVDHLEQLHKEQLDDVVIVPIGFASDHMEVKWDLDTLALGAAKELGMRARRASTVGADPRFVKALAEQVRVEATELCPRNCCLNPHGTAKPALCGMD